MRKRVITTKLAVIPPTPIEIPEIKYPLPRLAIETRTPEEQEWVATLIEGEGSFFIKRHRYDEITPETYKHEYLYPGFSMKMHEKPHMEVASKLLVFTLYEYPPAFMVYVEGAKAVAMANWAIPYLVPHGHRFTEALRILETFREHPTIKS